MYQVKEPTRPLGSGQWEALFGNVLCTWNKFTAVCFVYFCLSRTSSMAPGHHLHARLLFRLRWRCSTNGTFQVNFSAFDKG